MLLIVSSVVCSVTFAQTGTLRERFQAQRLSSDVSDQTSIKARFADRLNSANKTQDRSSGEFLSNRNANAESLIISNSEKVVFQSEGIERVYYVYRPESFRADEKLPVLMLLHGGKGNASVMAQTVDLYEEANQYGFIAVYPESNAVEWNDGRSSTETGVSDVVYLEAVANQLVDQWGAAANEIYVAGISSGGNMTQKLACISSNVFAGFGVIASNMAENLLNQCETPQTLKPMLLFYGTEDPLMTFDGEESESPLASMAKGYGEENRLSAPESMAFWARKKSCTSVKATLLPDIADDGTRVAQLDFIGCQTPLRGFVVIGGGHNWPGGKNSNAVIEKLVGKTTQDISANQIMFDYFGLAR